MKKKLLFILGLVLIGITSCEYNTIEPIVFEVPDGVSFATDVEPALIKNCAACHGSRSPVIKADRTYNSLIDGGYINTEIPESSSIYIKVTEGGHAPNTISSEELAYLIKWIEEGAIDN